MRTSLSHPLQIASVRPFPGAGRIGLTFCPGKKQPDAATGAWDRDLSIDVASIADWNASVIVTLVEDHGLAALKVPGLGAAVAASHMGWFHLPIADYSVPPASFEVVWASAGERLRARLRDGFDVVFHCKGGLGRAGSCTPHDIYDRGVELFGDGPEAFFPVLKTDDIGNIGTICCSDGEYPEAVRALAFGGAELVYRPSEAMPMTASSYPGGGSWMVQNRAHAEFNSVYMLCPNIGPVYLSPSSRFPVDIAGGNSHIVDFRGNISSYSASGANTMVAAMIDIEALRQFRMSNLNSNWMKDLRTELFARMYEKPIHPLNLWLKQEPLRHGAVDEIYRDNIRRLVERGTWTVPHHETPGARYTPADPEDADTWEDAKGLWRAWHNS